MQRLRAEVVQWLSTQPVDEIRVVSIATSKRADARCQSCFLMIKYSHTLHAVVLPAGGEEVEV